ncbi:hypothetical protein [Actinoplanes philippinensis]|uniref:hypothetical protein n=1 Tax=Actinoplanes philippinensis TaxID=35752 RepID=UPI0033C343DD
MLLTVVADYGIGDLAFAEVRQRIALVLPEAEVNAVPVPALDTVGAGFCVAQLAFGEGPESRVVYANVAPRHDRDEPRADNAGERLAAARLDSGVLVVGVASGSSLSFLAAEGVPVRAVDVPDRGSQFRSRDVFPAALAALARGDDSRLGEEITVGPPPERAVAYVDGYGNIKTTWDSPPGPVGATVRVRVGDTVAEATVSDGVFEVRAGTMSFAPGSSGWGGHVWWELLSRGGSASRLFGDPPAGTEVEIID